MAITDFSHMDRQDLEALAARAIIDAAGGENAVLTYHAVTAEREWIESVAVSMGISRQATYKRVRRVEEYLQSLRDRGLIPSMADAAKA